jgi:urate oxidase
LLGTSVTSYWDFAAKVLEKSAALDFNKIRTTIEQSLVNTFAGPSDKGVYSPSVQKTLYEMGKAALLATAKPPVIDRITLEMPNIHNITFPLGKDDSLIVKSLLMLCTACR